LPTSTHIVKPNVKDNGNSGVTTPPSKEIRRGQQKLPGPIEVARPSNSSDAVPSTDQAKTLQSPAAIPPPSRYASPPSRQASQSSLRQDWYTQEYQSQGTSGSNSIAAPTSFKMPRSAIAAPKTLLNGQQKTLSSNDIPCTTNAPLGVAPVPIPDPPKSLPQDTAVRQHSDRGHSSPPSRQASQSSLRYPPYTQDYQSQGSTRNSDVAAPTSFKMPHSGHQNLKPPVSTDIPYTTDAPSMAPTPDSRGRLPQDTAIPPPSVRGHSKPPSRQPSQSSFSHTQHPRERQDRDAPYIQIQKPPSAVQNPQLGSNGIHGQPPPRVEKPHANTSSKQDTTGASNPSRDVHQNTKSNQGGDVTNEPEPKVSQEKSQSGEQPNLTSDHPALVAMLLLMMMNWDVRVSSSMHDEPRQDADGVVCRD
jgi:hypothetical protein